MKLARKIVNREQP